MKRREFLRVGVMASAAALSGAQFGAAATPRIGMRDLIYRIKVDDRPLLSGVRRAAVSSAPLLAPLQGRLFENLTNTAADVRGIVYCLYEDGIRERVKVGFTAADVAKRVSDLQTGNPRRLRVLATAKGTIRDERRLHVQLGPWKVLNEWYDIVDETPQRIIARHFLRSECDSYLADRTKALFRVA